MNYLSFDLETTSKEIYGRKGNPFYNTILCSGYKYQEAKKPLSVAKDYIPNEREIGLYNLLIGHNIKYDLLYIWKMGELQESFKQGLKIWDTQLVEYILSAQQHKYPALRDIAVNKYGCKERVKHIQQGFEQGLDTSQIDMKLILEDVENDVMDTEQVALKQSQIVKDKGMMPLIKSQMDALLCTTEMEYNGMYIDQQVLNNNKKLLEDEIEQCKEQFLDYVKSINWPKEKEFKTSSTDHLSLLFFGGSLKYNTKVEDGIFKSGAKKGQVKYKNAEKVYNTLGLKQVPDLSWAREKDGYFETNEFVLKQIKHPASKAILKIRELAKQIQTYYTGTENFIHPFDSCVHHQLTHCGYERKEGEFGGGAHTGRLTSRCPNAQNQPRAGESKVKQHFTSRFPGGKIIEFDYKMLEVFILAYLCKDEFLINDLENGIDIYVETAKLVYDKNIISKDERQIVKAGVLAIIYGCGPFRLSRELKVNLDMAKKIIKAFYTRYPGVKEWHDRIIEIVNKNNGQFISCTGRIYQFELGDAPDFLKEKGILKSYKPQDIKNYMVQGLATADIVLMMLGRLWRASLEHRDKYLLINTVHDSVVVDCRPEYVDFACNYIKNQLESVKEAMKEVFNLDFNLNIKVDVKVGNSWWECGV